MFSKMFITSSGYDPECGRHVKDPYLGANPSLGACRPNVRKQVSIGGHIFTISGKIPGRPQFVMGGFEVAEKIHAREAWERFPERRLQMSDGDLHGNVIVDASGGRHLLDGHANFDRRLENYIVGRNPVVLATPAEIALGREQTLEVLRRLFDSTGRSPVEIVTRGARNLTEKQVCILLEWLYSLKERRAA